MSHYTGSVESDRYLLGTAIRILWKYTQRQCVQHASISENAKMQIQKQASLKVLKSERPEPWSLIGVYAYAVDSVVGDAIDVNNTTIFDCGLCHCLTA